jgi:hypothetical protein
VSNFDGSIKDPSTWCHHCSYKLVALELHNSSFYMVITKLHELHMYIVSYTMCCIHFNSCDLFNSTHVHRNTLNCNEM